MSDILNPKDSLAIVYNIWISGTKLELEKKACINSIDTKETVSGSDVATIKLTDPNFLFIEDNIFLEENSIKIEHGWSHSTHRETFEGYISALDIEFDSEGSPKITLTCMDNTHIMNRTKKNETFNNCTSATVVKKKCAEYGYTCVVEEGYEFKVQETITQSDQTDIDFIQKLAGDEVHPFTARLVGNTFYYVKMGKLETPKMTLTYKKYPHTIISFSPKINKETKKVEINKASIETSDKTISTTVGVASSTNEGSVSNNTSSSSPSSNSSNNSSSSSGGSYTYNPVTKEWTKN